MASKGENAKLTEFKADKGPSVILIAQYEKEDISSKNTVPIAAGSREDDLNRRKSNFSEGGYCNGASSQITGQFCDNHIKFSIENFYDKLDFSGVDIVSLGNNMGIIYRFPGARFSEVYLNTDFGKSAGYAFSVGDPRFKILKDSATFISVSSDLLADRIKDNPTLVQEVLSYKASMVKLYENTNLALIQYILGTHFVSRVGSDDLGIQYVEGCINKSYELGINLISTARTCAPRDKTIRILHRKIAIWDNYYRKLSLRIQGLPSEVNKKKIENLRDFVRVDELKSD